jgi:hypothetical protein
MKIKPIILKEAQEETQDYSKFLVDNKEVNEDLNDFVDGKIEHGYTLGISCFDEYYVAKKFEFYGIVGKKGRGKTTINQAIQVAHSVANDLIWVVAFQENSTWSMKLNYLNYLLCDFAKDVKKNNYPLYEKALKWVEEHFIFLKVETIKEALETTQYLIEEKDIDVHAVFLDPINSFDSGYYNSGNSYQDMVDTSKKILRHSKEVCSVHVSQHPTMSGQRQEEDVNSFQAEGGAILNKASFTYAINRDSGSSNNRISVDNVRNRHTGGNETSADNPVILNWSPTKIGLGNLIEGVKEQNIVEKLKRIYNPLSEDFGEKEPETLPMIDAQEAFGSVEDIPF